MEENIELKPFNKKRVNTLYFLYLLTIPVAFLSFWLWFFLLVGTAIAAKIFQDKTLTDEQNSHHKFQVKTFWGYLVLSILSIPLFILVMYALGAVAIDMAHALDFYAIFYALMGLETSFTGLAIALLSYFVIRIVKGFKAANDEKVITGGIFSFGKIHD